MGIPKHPKTNSILQTKLFDGITSFKELEARVASLPTEKERGDAFEVFAEAYLATQAIVGAQEVYPYDALSQGIKKRLGLRGKDQGVDGIFRTTTGEFVAYQVKYRCTRKPITWNEISTFVGLAEKAHNRLVFTNSYIIRDPMVERERLYCYCGYDLDQLRARDFQAIRDYLTETLQPIPRKELRPHQVEAQQRILEALKQADRTILEMACGTGKTLTALRIAESFGAKTLLCLFPSLALIRQTLQEWCKETKWKLGEWIFLCVCSDPTVQTYDDVVLANSDLSFPVSTESQTVSKFLTLPFDGVRVVFSTYQSSPVVAKGMTDPFDLAILDEAHRTAGREGTNFSFALSDNNLPIKKRLFMTATPRHYRIKEDLEESTVFSMDKPEVYGQVDYRYPFSKAVEEGQICDYRIVISCIGSENLRRHDLEGGETMVEGEFYRSGFAASLLALCKAIDDNGLKKVIAFTSRVKDAKKVAKKLPSFLPEVEPFFVSGDMQTAQREEEMQSFRESEQGVICNARCLTEGVDVPAVDAVAFLQPKKSKIDIVQAVGRAMRTSPGKRYGFVVLPVHLEVGETEAEAVKKTNFDMVWDVVRYLLEQDSQAEEIFQKIRIEQGTGRPIDFSKLREKVQVLGINIALEELERTIYLRLVERTVSDWWEMYGRLVSYKEEHGNCNVPQKYPGGLGSWVANQRSRKSIRNRQEIDALNSIGFEWQIDTWMPKPYLTFIETYFKDGRDFSRLRKVNKSAARWLKETIDMYPNVDYEFKEFLEKLGFNRPYWELWRAEQIKRLAGRLDNYIKVNRSIEKLQRKAPKLYGLWNRVKIKVENSDDRLIAEERKLYEKVMDYDPLHLNFLKNFEALEAYLNENNGSLGKLWANNPDLFNAIDKQRRHIKAGKYPERKEKFLTLFGTYGIDPEYWMEHGVRGFNIPDWIENLEKILSQPDERTSSKRTGRRGHPLFEKVRRKDWKVYKALAGARKKIKAGGIKMQVPLLRGVFEKNGINFELWVAKGFEAITPKKLENGNTSN